MRAQRPRTSAATALAVAAIAAAGCGGDSEPERAEPVGDVRVGSVAQLAQCRDWLAGDREERLATVEDIKEQINLRDGTGETPELDDADAYRVIDSTCSRDYTEGLRLYKIYAKATGFAAFASQP